VAQITWVMTHPISPSSTPPPISPFVAWEPAPITRAPKRFDPDIPLVPRPLPEPKRRDKCTPYEAHLTSVSKLATKALELVGFPDDKARLSYTNAKGEIQDYELSKTIEFGELAGSAGRVLGIGGDSTRAFCFVPRNGKGPGLILYHQAYNVSSTLLTFDPRGIGRALLQWRGNQLNAEVEAFMKTHGKEGIVSVGHSLGGVLANLTAIYGPKDIPVTSYTFSAPGIHKDAFKDYEKRMNSLRDKCKPNIISFEGENDRMAQFGWRKAGKLYTFKGVSEHNDIFFNRDLQWWQYLQLVGEEDSQIATLRPLDFKKRLEKLPLKGEQNAREWGERRASPSHAAFWSSTSLRGAAWVLTPVVLTSMGVKRVLIGGPKEGPLQYGILGLLTYKLFYQYPKQLFASPKK
jgi:pimeloyl-ACP methyl ester carboxylesterase